MHYEIDDDTSKHVLTLADYGGEGEGSRGRGISRGQSWKWAAALAGGQNRRRGSSSARRPPPVRAAQEGGRRSGVLAPYLALE